MVVPVGNTYFLALPLLLKLQLAMVAALLPALYNSTQSELVVVPLVTAPEFSAITSLMRTVARGIDAFMPPGEPLRLRLERQLAGSSGSPLGLMISSE